MIKWRVHFILRYLYLSQGKLATAVDLPFLCPLCMHVQPSLAEPMRVPHAGKVRGVTQNGMNVDETTQRRSFCSVTSLMLPGCNTTQVKYRESSTSVLCYSTDF